MSDVFPKMARDFAECPDVVESLPNLHRLDPQHPAFMDRINELRPELFALAAVIGDRVVDTALSGRDARPPYGLLDDKGAPVEEIDDMGGLSDDLYRTLASSMYDIFYHGPQKEEMDPVIARLEKLCSVFHLTYDGPRYETAASLISSGLGTASSELITCLGAVTRLVRRENPKATNQDIAAVAHNSVTLPRKVASVNLDHLNKTSILVRRAGEAADGYREIGVQALELKTDQHGSEFVDFVAPLSQLPSPYDNIEEFITIDAAAAKHFRTLGCPALARLTGSSPITKLWHWTVDIAEQANLFHAEDV